MNQGAPPSNPDVANLLKQVDSAESSGELIEVLARGENIRVERIVSLGHCSEPGFWYDEPQAEWVTVLSGEARIRFLSKDRVAHLRPGDHLTIGPHEKHRVEWTTPNEQTVWLAIYFSPTPCPES